MRINFRVEKQVIVIFIVCVGGRGLSIQVSTLLNVKFSIIALQLKLRILVNIEFL